MSLPYVLGIIQREQGTIIYVDIIFVGIPVYVILTFARYYWKQTHNL